MSRDRLQELQSEARGQDHQSMPMIPQPSELDPSSQFYQDVRNVEQEIDTLRYHIETLSRANQRSLQAVGDAQTQRILTEVENIQTDLTTKINSIKQMLEHLTAQNQHLPHSHPDSAARRGRTTALTRTFQDTIEHYRDVDHTHWSKTRDRLIRQYRIAKPTATEDEINSAVDDERAGQIFTESILASTRMSDARRVLRSVESRQREMRQIEKKALELNALFVRLNEIVNAQQEVIDTVEIQVNETVKETEAANVQVTKAIEIRKSSRKKLWIISIIVLLVLIGIGIALWQARSNPSQLTSMQ
ncbi:hypothetical protein IWQ60_003938 [Tieghemiomyces parasiticus]|uniref:t-SNARE coiled-coil homology domain-containing protein n=1 Tax=Tieghemiomyces parasiticus TaxID=78921 RepID=A0A9W8A8Q8_9FUNG|nr:hypothetical protein IWQ60_003938 [Tieghemiomyces parasiticus]